MNGYILEKLIRILQECGRHFHRMEGAAAKMSDFMPLSTALTEDEIEHIDQFLFRFSKLQDAMGQKLFKSALTFLGEPEMASMPFMDILSRAEQLKMIENKDEWLILREIRNDLAHSYEEDADSYQKINQIFAKRVTLHQVLESITVFLTQHGLILRSE